MEVALNKLKLTKAQQRVMDWLSQGWGARVSHGAAVEINGTRVCNVDTMATLVRLGLAERETRAPYWMATEAGRMFSPYRKPADGEPATPEATE